MIIIYYILFTKLCIYETILYIISHFAGGKHWNCLDPMVDCSNLVTNYFFGWLV